MANATNDDPSLPLADDRPGPLWPWWILVLCALGCLAPFYLAWYATAAHAWTPVEATVERTLIESTRPGTPQWSLLVDFAYEAGGQRYEKQRIDVLHRTDRSETVAEQRQWPAGRRFTVYCREDNPEWFSLEKDGGSEAVAVLAVLLSLVLAATAAPLAIVQWRRWRGRTNPS